MSCRKNSWNLSILSEAKCVAAKCLNKEILTEYGSLAKMINENHSLKLLNFFEKRL